MGAPLAKLLTVVTVAADGALVQVQLNKSPAFLPFNRPPQICSAFHFLTSLPSQIWSAPRSSGHGVETFNWRLFRCPSSLNALIFSSLILVSDCRWLCRCTCSSSLNAPSSWFGSAVLPCFHLWPLQQFIGGCSVFLVSPWVETSLKSWNAPVRLASPSVQASTTTSSSASTFSPPPELRFGVSRISGDGS
jgi:hypothetical protein